MGLDDYGMREMNLRNNAREQELANRVQSVPLNTLKREHPFQSWWIQGLPEQAQEYLLQDWNRQDILKNPNKYKSSLPVMNGVNIPMELLPENNIYDRNNLMLLQYLNNGRNLA